MLTVFRELLRWLRNNNFAPGSVSVTLRFSSMSDRLRAQTIIYHDAGLGARGFMSPPATAYGIPIKFTDPTDD